MNRNNSRFMAIFLMAIVVLALSSCNVPTYVPTPTASSGMSRVWDRQQERFLPEVGSIYQCPNGAMNQVLLPKHYNPVSKNRWVIHGNVNYHNRGVESWFGQDFHPGCGTYKQKSSQPILSPISGIMWGDTDGLANGGYSCTFTGTGPYKGLFVDILHLAGPCTKNGAKVQVQRGDVIGKEGSDVHSHVTVLWGDGTRNIKNKDVPYTALLNQNVEVGVHSTRFGYGYMPPDSYFDKWMMVADHPGGVVHSQETSPKKYTFSASKQGGGAIPFNVKNYFAWPSGVEVSKQFTGEWKIPAGAEHESVNRQFGPYTASHNMKKVTHWGDGACNATSMVRYVLEESGLEVTLQNRSQQGHIINDVQYPIPGVPKKYWTTVYAPGQDVYVQNPFDYPVYLRWSIRGDNITLWVDGPSSVSYQPDRVQLGSMFKYIDWIKGITSKEVIFAVLAIVLAVAIVIWGVGPVLSAIANVIVWIFRIVRYILRRLFLLRRKVIGKRRGPAWVGFKAAADIIVIGLICRVALLLPMLLFGLVSRAGAAPPSSWARVFNDDTKYAVVFGSPGTGIGTLGTQSSTYGLISEGQKWQKLVAAESGRETVFVLVPRFNHRFGYGKMEDLIVAVKDHHPDGIVLPEVGGNYDRAFEVVDRFTPLGLDGVAVDLEFRQSTSFEEIRILAEYMARRRSEAGLSGDAILLLWHVFDWKVRADVEGLNVPGVRFAIIHDGYGSLAGKVAAYTGMRETYGLGPDQTGWMAFDRRWPVNQSCSGYSISRGFDCQSWRKLVQNSTMQSASWWAQQ